MRQTPARNDMGIPHTSSIIFYGFLWFTKTCGAYSSTDEKNREQGALQFGETDTQAVFPNPLSQVQLLVPASSTSQALLLSALQCLNPDMVADSPMPCRTLCLGPFSGVHLTMKKVEGRGIQCTVTPGGRRTLSDQHRPLWLHQYPPSTFSKWCGIKLSLPAIGVLLAGKGSSCWALSPRWKLDVLTVHLQHQLL